MKKRVIILISLISLFALCVAAIGSYLGMFNFLMYNRDIDTAKETGGFVKYTDLYGDTLEDFLDFADTVITGCVVSAPRMRYEEWTFYEDGEDVHSAVVPLTEFTIKVDKVLYGDAPETIAFVQMGEVGSDEYEKQLRPGDTVTVIAKLSEEGYYSSVQCENGIFYHTDDGLYTYSSKPDLCRYDGVKESVLTSDIRRAVLLNGMKPETNFSKRAAMKEA